VTLKFLPILFCLIPATVFAEKLPATGPCHDLGQATFDMCRTGFKTAKVDDKSTCQTAKQSI
jgi:hypothetical protein